MSVPHAHLTLAFGLLGNLISFCVFLAPLPTFYQVYKKKSTEGFQSVPYVVALFSAMLWIYYAMLKSNAMLLITINSFGCVIETFYIGFFLFYAPKNTKLQSLILIALLNVVGFGLIVVLTRLLTNGTTGVHVVGWICLVFALSVFVAPLGVLRQVIKTKSVEYMPFLLSFFLTLSAVIWFFYGLLLKDFNIVIPNVLGFTFGILQMVLYMIYKNSKKVTEISSEVIEMEEQNIPKHVKEQIIDVVKLSVIVSEMIPVVAKLIQNGHTDDHKIEVIIPNVSVKLRAIVSEIIPVVAKLIENEHMDDHKIEVIIPNVPVKLSAIVSEIIPVVAKLIENEHMDDHKIEVIIPNVPVKKSAIVSKIIPVVAKLIENGHMDDHKIEVIIPKVPDKMVQVSD